jgi:hypothetical protein
MAPSTTAVQIDAARSDLPTRWVFFIEMALSLRTERTRGGNISSNFTRV